MEYTTFTTERAAKAYIASAIQADGNMRGYVMKLREGIYQARLWG